MISYIKERIKQEWNYLKCKYRFLKTYFSPFNPIIPNLYVGEIAVGTPLFFPRKIVYNKEKKVCNFVDKKVGFDFVGLGWKTKWHERDYRFEWNPVWSFVFFGYQIALTFRPEHPNHYWECWLYYELSTDKTKSKEERIEQARTEFGCTWTTGEGEEINYWDKVLK